jgi:hypothetical protein
MTMLSRPALPLGTCEAGERAHEEELLRPAGVCDEPRTNQRLLCQPDLELPAVSC